LRNWPPRSAGTNMNQSSRPRLGSESQLEVRRMLAGEIDAACQVIGLAFAENPNTLAVAGGDRAKARRMMQRAVRVAKLGRRYSHVIVATQRGELRGVLNAARWPHCQLR